MDITALHCKYSTFLKQLPMSNGHEVFYLPTTPKRIFSDSYNALHASICITLYFYYFSNKFQSSYKYNKKVKQRNRLNGKQ